MTVEKLTTRQQALDALHRGDVLDTDQMDLLPRATRLRNWWHQLLNHHITETRHGGTIIAFGLFSRSWDTTMLDVCSCGAAWTRWANVKGNTQKPCP